MDTGCVAIEYVAATAVMTLRVDPDLLAALKARAKSEGRSVSAEVVRMIRREVQPIPSPRPRRKASAGMFREFEAPALAEFRAVRATGAAIVAGRVTRRK